MNDGNKIPFIGLGTWNLRGKSCIKALHSAFSLGYRHIDTASYYGNEKEVGDAIRTSGIAREEFFVTTKIWPNEFGTNNARRAFDQSKSRLGLEFIDLYLIHWPSDQKRTDETWRELIKLREEGNVRSIGVSNFSINQIEHLKEIGDVLPANNQVRFNPKAYNQNLLDYCKALQISVTAYSPLGEGRLVSDPKVKQIAEKYGKSPAQVLLRWGLQKGTIQIPKSSDPKRQLENIEIFDFKLGGEDMKLIDHLN